MNKTKLWSTISTWRWAYLGLLCLVLFAARQAPAATIRISQEPSSSIQVADGDLFLIDIYQGLDTNSQPFYVTKKITWSLMRQTLTNYFSSNAVSFVTLISSNAFFTNLYSTSNFFQDVFVTNILRAKNISVTNITIQTPGSLSNLNWQANQLIGANSNQVAVTFVIGTGLSLNTNTYTLNVGGFTPFSVLGGNSNGLATSFTVGPGLQLDTNTLILSVGGTIVGPLIITNPPGQSFIILGDNNTTNLSVSGVTDLVKLWVEGYIRDFGLGINQLVATDGAHQLTSVTLGSGLSYDSGTTTLSATGSGGTVTSVNVAGAQGLTSSGGPVTGSGTITVGASGTIATNGMSVGLTLSNGLAVVNGITNKDFTTAGVVTNGTDGKFGTSATLPASLVGPYVSSIDIPMGAWFTNNCGDGASVSTASMLTLTNSGDTPVFTVSATSTNEIRTRFSMPRDWDGNSVQLHTFWACTGTNNASASKTNFVVKYDAAAVGPADRLDSLTFGSAVFWTNNCNAFPYKQGSEGITSGLTVGNSPGAGKGIVWRIQVLGNHSASTETNSSLYLAGFTVEYRAQPANSFSSTQ